MLDRLIVGAIDGLLIKGGLSLIGKVKKLKLKNKIERGDATDDEIFRYNELLGDSLEEYIESSELMHSFLAKNPNHLFPNITLGVNGLIMIILRRKRVANSEMNQIPEFAEVRKFIENSFELISAKASDNQDTWIKGNKVTSDMFPLYMFKLAQASYFQGYIAYLDGDLERAKTLKTDSVKIDKRVLKILAYGQEKGI